MAYRKIIKAYKIKGTQTYGIEKSCKNPEAL